MTSKMTTSRKGFGTINLNQDLLPFLCREDDVDVKDEKVRNNIAEKAARASSSVGEGKEEEDAEVIDDAVDEEVEWG